MRHTKTMLMTALATTALLSAGAYGQGMTPQDFVTKATIAGKTEVAAARIALKNSQADDVKQFARQMIKDHTKAGDELASIAKGKSLQVPAHVDAKHREVLAGLRSQSGAAFDAAYAKQMVADHQEAVALFTAEAGDKTDPDLAAFAQKTLPTLQHHLSMANSLASAHTSAGQ
jgi:putative membrane protein